MTSLLNGIDICNKAVVVFFVLFRNIKIMKMWEKQIFLVKTTILPEKYSALVLVLMMLLPISCYENFQSNDIYKIVLYMYDNL